MNSSDASSRAQTYLRRLVAALMVTALGGCTHRVKKTVEVKYDREVVNRVKVGQREVTETVSVPARIQAGSRVGIFPFTEHGAVPGLGNEFAAEIEHILANDASGHVRVVNRAQLGSILNERELADAALAARSRKLTKSLSHVVSGHASAHGASYTLFIKAIDVQTTDVVVSERLQGESVSGLAQEAARLFFPHEATRATGQVEDLYEEKRETVKDCCIEEEREVTETDWFATGALVVLGLLVVAAIGGASGGGE